MFRQRIYSLATENEITLEYYWASCQSIFSLVQAEILQPDIVILDIEMPVMDGITAMKYIRSLVPNTKVIVLSSYGTIVN